MTIKERLGVIAYWLAWPGLHIYLRNTHRTRVLIQSGEKVLLVKTWLGDGKWGLPGGGLHGGEDETRGAQREVEEETGLAVGELRKLAVEPYRTNGMSVILHYFVCQLARPGELRLQKVEIYAAEWFPADALPKQTKPEVYRIVELAGKV